MSSLPVFHFASQLRHQVHTWRRKGHRVALVPTMGSLHEGHLSLVRLAKTKADKVVVSVFVNPTQFAPNEDFANYPRNAERDWHLLSRVRTDVMYAPHVTEIYPDDFATRVNVGGVSQTLEGISRPHFFSGVATVVTKLFLQALPDIAIFGEKDYQQLLVVQKLVKDLGFPITIVPGPIVRENDGLAMSSRNAYLSEAERAMAPLLFAVLSDAANGLLAGDTVDEVRATGKGRLEAAGFRTDYLEVRDAETLEPLEGELRTAARVLVAAFLGKTRLIDNVPAIPA